MTQLRALRHFAFVYAPIEMLYASSAHGDQREEADVVDKGVFRQAMGRFPTGVTVVTSHYQGRSYGMTLSAMTSLTLEPPMLLICVNKAVPTERAISASDRFVVNMLADYQERVARRFAKPAADKFAGITTFTGALEVPIIAGGLAYFECTVRDRLTAGTHTIFTGEVHHAQVFERRPLLYCNAEFGSLEASGRRRRVLPEEMSRARYFEDSLIPVGASHYGRLGSQFSS